MNKNDCLEFAAEAVFERAKLDATDSGANFLYYDGEDFFLSPSSGIREYGWECGNILEWDSGDYSEYYENDVDDDAHKAIVEMWAEWLAEIADEYEENNE